MYIAIQCYNRLLKADFNSNSPSLLSEQGDSSKFCNSKTKFPAKVCQSVPMLTNCEDTIVIHKPEDKK